MKAFLKRILRIDTDYSTMEWDEVSKRNNRKEVYFVCSIGFIVASSIIGIGMLIGLPITLTNIIFIYIITAILSVPPATMIMRI